MEYVNVNIGGIQIFTPLSTITFGCKYFWKDYA